MEDEPVSVLFPGATGKGVRIGVIDSGVYTEHPHILSCAGGVAIDAEGEPAEGDWVDRLGHGTAVMAAIQEKAPDSVCYAVKVFHRSLRTTAEALLGAINWCVAHEIDLINLSLGTPNPDHAAKFREAIARANRAGSVLVAARETNGIAYYPGCLAGVLSVGLDWDCPPNLCCVAENAGETVFYASGFPRPMPGVPRTRNLSGISFAVANATGFVARAFEQRISRGERAGRSSLVQEIVRAECLARQNFRPSATKNGPAFG